MLHPMLLEAGLLRVPKILVLLFAFFFFLSCFLSLFFQCLYRTSIPWSSTICILLSATPLRLPHFTDSWGTRWTRNRAFSALPQGKKTARGRLETAQTNGILSLGGRRGGATGSNHRGPPGRGGAARAGPGRSIGAVLPGCCGAAAGAAERPPAPKKTQSPKAKRAGAAVFA